MFKLYSDYGFTSSEIGQLFSAGYLSSLVFGTYIGASADYYGRKRSCLLFTVFYGLSCVTKHFNSFVVLLIGRLLSGVATSLLHSSFEAWMVHEHHRLKYPDIWLNETFQLMSFGKSLVAIASGVVGSLVARNFSIVNVFDVALLLLIVCCFLIATQWDENYGDIRNSTTTDCTAHAVTTSSRSEGVEEEHRNGTTNSIHHENQKPYQQANSFTLYIKAFQLFRSDFRVTLLFLVQSGFESAMYIFVFNWTPALEHAASHLNDISQAPSAVDAVGGAGSMAVPHGLVFASFMLALMVGSQLYSVIGHASPQWLLSICLLVAAVTLYLPPAFQNNFFVVMFCFLVFEMSCGFYFPSVGTMRSKIIPGEIRSTVLNFFRVGLNSIVIFVLSTSKTSTENWNQCAFFVTVSLVANTIMASLYSIGMPSPPILIELSGAAPSNSAYVASPIATTTAINEDRVSFEPLHTRKKSRVHHKKMKARYSDEECEGDHANIGTGISKASGSSSGSIDDSSFPVELRTKAHQRAPYSTKN